MEFSYAILQLDKDRIVEKGFRSLDAINREFGKVFLGDYTTAYIGLHEGKNEEIILEHLFHIFNVDRPTDFWGHSMSVSDVIELNNTKTNETKFYYCDSFGFKEIEFQLIN